jgi:type IV secretory pathway VirB2 component (pilin)
MQHVVTAATPEEATTMVSRSPVRARFSCLYFTRRLPAAVFLARSLPSSESGPEKRSVSMGSHVAVLRQWCVSPRGQQWFRWSLVLVVFVLANTPSLFALGIEDLADKVLAVFQGRLLTALCGIGIIVGGLMFIFGEHGAKRHLFGVLAGASIALGAMQLVNWIP